MRKINIDPKKPDPKSIKDKRNFNEILNRFNEVQAKGNSNSSFGKGFSLNSILVFTGIVIVSAVVYLWPEQTPNISYSEINGADSSSFTLEPNDNENKLLVVKKPFITPPLTEIDIPYKSFKFKTEKGANLTYKESTIKVPKNAFIDNAGKTVKGDVELKYREFHDVVDFFVSGIPMEYDSVGKTYTFESAGMMEIKGFQKNEPIFIAPNKNLIVELASQDTSRKYNLYYLDTVEKNWTFIEKSRVKAVKQQEVQNPTTIAANEKIEELKKALASDEKKFNAKIDILTKEVNEIENKIKDFVASTSLPSAPNEYDNSKYTFNIDVDGIEFPELSAFEDLKFEVGEENEQFNSDFYKVTWDKAEISKQVEGVSYLLELTSDEKLESLIVYPVYRGKDLETAILDYNQKLELYNSRLAKRKKIEKEKKEQLTKNMAELKASRLNYEQKINEEMAKRKMAKDLTNNIVKLSGVSRSAAAIRTIYVPTFGTFNCDHPIQFPKGKSVLASFETEEGAQLKINELHLIVKNTNALYSFFNTEVNQINFNKKDQNFLFGITKDYQLAFTDKEYFDKTEIKGKYHTFKMNLIKERITSHEQLKELLDL